MKRNLSILSEKDWREIDKWYFNPKQTREIMCPFYGGVRGHDKGNKCRAIFPGLKLSTTPCRVECPCHRYKLTYVTSVAGKILKEMRAAQE